MVYIAGMFRIPAFFFLLLFRPLMLFCQQNIQGQVVNADTKTPVAGSSVFITNTSFGTVTNKEGRFELTNIPTGKYELIVSSIGFETTVYSFNTTELPLKLRVELTQKVRELENVTVEPSVEEGWDKWGKVFLETFIGTTANSSSCKIRNEDAIHFRYYRKSNRLEAYSDEPLVIENKALGYNIKYQLEEFEVNYKANTTFFLGYSLFEEIDRNGKAVHRRWDKNRLRAYNGSMMHFMWSVYYNDIAGQGFEVRRMIRRPNLEKQRVRKIYRPVSRGMVVSITDKNGRPVNLPETDTLYRDSVEYYQRILRQKDEIDTYGQALLTADSLVVGQQGEYKVVFFTDYLYVTYKKELEETQYLDYYHERRGPTFQRSYVWLPNGKAIAIDPKGSYYPPQELYSMAYWGWSEKVSNLLPLDYKPE